VLFEQAISHEPWTIASFASILSGFPDTRAFDGELRRSLVEDLAAAGVRTAAFTEGGYCTAQFGFDRGFGEFTEEHYLHGGGIERTVDSALAWLAEPGDAPFFLLVHSYEAHMPYLRTTFTAGLERPRFGEHFDQAAHEAVDSGALELTDAELAYLDALYDGGVHAADREVGRLLDGIAELGLAQEIVVIVTSDHGEELAERRFAGHAGDHGHALSEELVRVPLIVADPRRAPRRVRAQVRSMDVLPTALELLGVAVPDDVAGRSLVPLLDGRDEPAERVASGGSVEKGPEREFVRLGGKKLVRRLEEAEPDSPFDGLPELALHDLAADPLEHTNLAAERPELVRALIRELARVRSAGTIDAGGLDVPPELAEELRALGY
jgi:arylsulfatase A-like enzyme